MNGRQEHLIGYSAEKAVECCCEVAPLASWCEEAIIYKASKEQDSLGIDVFVSTRWMEIPLQVKSSYYRANIHKEKHPGIPVVVIKPDDSEIVIRKKVAQIVHNYLQKKLGYNPIPPKLEQRPVSEESNKRTQKRKARRKRAKLRKLNIGE